MEMKIDPQITQIYTDIIKLPFLTQMNTNYINLIMYRGKL